MKATSSFFFSFHHYVVNLLSHSSPFTLSPPFFLSLSLSLHFSLSRSPTNSLSPYHPFLPHLKFPSISLSQSLSLPFLPSLSLFFLLSPLSSFSLPFLLPLSVLCWNTQDWLFSSYHLHYGEICCSTQLKREIVEGRNLLHSQINEIRNSLPAKVRKFCKLFSCCTLPIL